MGSIGAPEILVILLVALLVLGPNRLPDAARQIGRFMGELRRMSAGFQSEIRDAMRETTPRPPGPTGAVAPAPTRSENGSAGERKYVWSDLPTSPDADDGAR